MSDSYSVQDYVEDMRAIAGSAASEDEIFSRLEPLAQRLVADRSWLEPKHYEANEEQGFGVHLLHEEPDHSLAVFVVNWLPGRGTPPHDHGTWALVAGIEGIERNIRYRRVDDGSRDGVAELEVKDEFDAEPGEVVCVKTGGIHKVVNQTDRMTLSLHCYGRHINHTDRSQFDLETNTRKRFILNVD